MRTPRLKDAFDLEGLHHPLFQDFAENFKVKDIRRTATSNVYAVFAESIDNDDEACHIIQKWSEHALSIHGTQPSDSTKKTFLKFFCHLRDGEEDAAERELRRHWRTVNPGLPFTTHRHDDGKQSKGKNVLSRSSSNTRPLRAEQSRAQLSLPKRDGQQVVSNVEISVTLGPSPVPKSAIKKAGTKSRNQSDAEVANGTLLEVLEPASSTKPPKTKAAGGWRMRSDADLVYDAQADTRLTDKPNKSQSTSTPRIQVTHVISPESISTQAGKQDKSQVTVSSSHRQRGRPGKQPEWSSSTFRHQGAVSCSTDVVAKASPFAGNELEARSEHRALQPTSLQPQSPATTTVAAPLNKLQRDSAFTSAGACVTSISSHSVDGKARSKRGLSTSVPPMDRVLTDGLSMGKKRKKKKTKARAPFLMQSTRVDDSTGSPASGQTVLTPGVKIEPSIKVLTLSKRSDHTISHSLEGVMRETPSDVQTVQKRPAACLTLSPMSRVSVEQTVCLLSGSNVDFRHPNRILHASSTQAYAPHVYQGIHPGPMLEKAELIRSPFQQMDVKDMAVKAAEASISRTLHCKPAGPKRLRLSSVASTLRKQHSEHRLSLNTSQRPPLPHEPPIWATSRQEICETLDYFRSYQSGVYTSDGFVKGYLLSAFGSERDIFHLGGRFIVSHGGGKSESVLQSRIGARHQLAGDQKITDRSVRALMRNYEESRPLVLLADDKYDKFPYDLSSTLGSVYPYVVLGFYWIPYAWAEYEAPSSDSQSVVRWKFAFQWCEGQGDPWWTSTRYVNEAIAMSPVSDFLYQNEKPSSASVSPRKRFRFLDEELCTGCMKTSPSVYKQGWMCLNPCCAAFWTSKHGGSPATLEYRESFLQLVSATHADITLADLKPSLILEAPDGVATGLPFSKGWHCESCGRLACRSDWKCWKCPNCYKEHQVENRFVAPHEFWLQRPTKPTMHAVIGIHSGIRGERPAVLYSMTDGRDETIHRLTYVLPLNRGRIHLVLGNPRANRRANEAFSLYQEEAKSGSLELRRYALKTHRLRGPMLTNYFSQNSGEPYQYVSGTGQTVPFDRASKSVIEALAIIKERTQKALGCEVPFNEILTAAYMERQKMSFHSDSEIGLGPVVASLSLGSMAYMHFRLKDSQQRAKGSSQIDLTLTLRHGDVVVMEGAQIQDLYEHTVSPVNFRVAATARCIGPDHPYYKA